jgi:hypothetical protein
MIGDLLGELIHMIMEVEKSNKRLPVSYRPWDVRTMAPSKSEGLRTSEADGVTFSLRPKAKELGATVVKFWSPKAREPGILVFKDREGSPCISALSNK